MAIIRNNDGRENLWRGSSGSHGGQSMVEPASIFLTFKREDERWKLNRAENQVGNSIEQKVKLKTNRHTASRSIPKSTNEAVLYICITISAVYYIRGQWWLKWKFCTKSCLVEKLHVSPPRWLQGMDLHKSCYFNLLILFNLIEFSVWSHWRLETCMSVNWTVDWKPFRSRPNPSCCGSPRLSRSLQILIILKIFLDNWKPDIGRIHCMNLKEMQNKEKGRRMKEPLKHPWKS